jgi:MOSC domain-containing protein YiiM
MTVYRSSEEIEAGLVEVLASPQEEGRVALIVARPAEDERQVRPVAYLSPEGGLEGDRWATASSLRLPDGRPDPRGQISLMNARLLKLIAVEEERMALAGDNLVVDLDLSAANLPVGQRLVAGEAVLEVTDLAHTGCDKFSERFGREAVLFVNANRRKALRLRGCYARVVKAGTVRAGDLIRKEG